MTKSIKCDIIITERKKERNEMKKFIAFVIAFVAVGAVLIANIDHIKGNTVFIGKGLYEEETAKEGIVHLERKDIRTEREYEKVATVEAINYKENVVFVNDGQDIWGFTGIENYHIHDTVTVKFNDKATNNIYDDEIVSVEKK